MLPPNVETTLTLNEDGTYCLKQESTNDSDSSEVLNGIFKVLDGSILMLEHLSSGYNILLKTEDIHPPKTGISVHFSGSLV